MSKTTVFVCLFLLISINSITFNPSIIELVDPYFEEDIAGFPWIFVAFYIPENDRYSEDLAPQFNKLDLIIREEGPGIALGKINGLSEKKTAKYKIPELPTVALFSRGEIVGIYTGMKTYQKMYTWLKKQTSPKILQTEKDRLLEIEKNSEFSLVLIGDEEKCGKLKFDIFTNLSNKYNNILFFTCNSSDCAEEFKSENCDLILLKQFDDNRVNFKLAELEFTEENVDRWIQRFHFPILMNFNQISSEIIFSQKKPAVVLFIEDVSKNYEKIKDLFTNFAIENYGKILFVISGIENEYESVLCQFLEIKSSDFPTVFILDTTDISDIKKFKISGKVNQKNLRIFLDSYYNNNIARYFRSEEVLDNTHRIVKHLAAKNFEESIFGNVDHDIVLFVYSSECDSCESPHVMYEKVAADLKNNEKLMFAEIDLARNDLPGIPVHEYPTYIVFPKNDKRKYHISKYNLNEEQLIKFIQENSSNEVVTTKEDL